MQPSSTPGSLAGNEENYIIFCRGTLSLCGTAVDAAAHTFLHEVDKSWQDNRQKRDGDHFHVTLLTKAELQRVCDHLRSNVEDTDFVLQLQAIGCLPDPDDSANVAQCIASFLASRQDSLSSWVALGRGRAKNDTGEATFAVLLWPIYATLRRLLRLDPHDVHITLGFLCHDVHDKPKGVSSLVDGSPTADSVEMLLAEANNLLEAGRGSDIDSDGIEQLIDAALLGAVSHGDTLGESGSLHVLCELHGRMKRGDRLLLCAERLLEIDPSDEVGTRSRAYALVMLKQYSEALPALEQARGYLHKLNDDMRVVEEKRLQQAVDFCNKKIVRSDESKSSKQSLDTIECQDEEFVRDFLEHRSLKFPTTAHIKNLGAATRDDKLLDTDRVQLFCGSGRAVCAEEKIDGANLGISLDSQYQPRLQARSKLVNWETDPQFRGLKEWLDEHGPVLCQLLERNRHILFGEWCAYLHTVPYNRLPGYFVAFDIFDRRVGRFLSRQSFHTRLASTQEPRIPVVPVVDHRPFATLSEMEALLERQSLFGQEVLEGVYFRVDEERPSDGSTDSYLVDRCKLVRKEFQQAIEESDGWRGRGKNELDMAMKVTYPETCFRFAVSSNTTAIDDVAPAAKDNYPKTPHLPFSPGVNDDDTRISDCSTLIAEEVVVTEKLDGGNCCIKNGQVYGRTHSQPATHESFSAVKELAHNFGAALAGLELFGENMQGIHSIEYGNLSSFFYLFGVRSNGDWYSWDEVVTLAEQLDIPTVPLLFRGRFASEKQLQGCLETWLKEPSAVGASINPEGFVVRRSSQFRGQDFANRIAKFVRANHLQTDDAWKRKWKKARLGSELPKKPLRSLGEPLRNKLGNPRDRHKVTTPGIGEVELPRNFSFILDDVAVSSTPKRPEQILAMENMGISLVVTLTEETPLPPEWFANTGVRNSFVPVANYHPPTSNQTDAILQDIARVVTSGQRVMVHCGGGKGRAGTVAACLLLRYGLTSVHSGLEMEREEGLSVSCQMQSDEVLTVLRDLRPGSVETERQERFIRGYASLLWSRKAEAPDASELVRTTSLARSEQEDEELMKSELFSCVEQTPATNSTNGVHSNTSGKDRAAPRTKKEEKQLEKMKKDMAKRAPKYILMVGLPGSGKSTFSCALEKSGEWMRANQDDLGRKGCEKKVAEVVPQVRQGKTRVVLDRCNTTKEERKEWLDILGNPSPKEVVCIFVDTPSETCKHRAAARLDHPTIRAGGGARIIDDMSKRLERPSASEGFSAVEIVRSADDAATFLSRIGVDPSPVLAVEQTSSVLVATTAEEANVVEDVPVAVEEKVDDHVEENPIPESFRIWLQSSLREEMDEADAEGLGAAVEVILMDPEAISDAVEVLNDGGAPTTAGALEQEWKYALANTFAPPSRVAK